MRSRSACRAPGSVRLPRPPWEQRHRYAPGPGRPPNGRGCRLGEAEVAHLPLAYQLGHRAHGVFDGDAFVDAMLVVQVDVIDAQPLERAVTGGAHILGPAVDPLKAAVGAADVAELRGQHDLVPPAGDGAA